MCAVSMISHQWTTPQFPSGPNPNYVPWTQQFPTPDIAAQMLDVLQRLEKIDKALGALDCKLEAREKTALKRKLKRRATRK